MAGKAVLLLVTAPLPTTYYSPGDVSWWAGKAVLLLLLTVYYYYYNSPGVVSWWEGSVSAWCGMRSCTKARCSRVAPSPLLSAMNGRVPPCGAARARVAADTARQ